VEKSYPFFDMDLKKYLKKVYSKSVRDLHARSTDTVFDNKNSSREKILMFGWELPPFNSGGLGVACYELAESLSKNGADITFVLPKKNGAKLPFGKLLFAEKEGFSEDFAVEAIDSPIAPYMNGSQYSHKVSHLEDKDTTIYDPNLIGEVKRYGKKAGQIAKKGKFDIIHAHDWLSFPAGIEAKRISKKPLVVHVHATEFDRAGDGPVDKRIYEIEKQGLEAADRVITVSNFTRNKVAKNYGINLNKIDVVHNGINASKFLSHQPCFKELKKAGKKVVLFLGRITIQKGPDYFVKTAKQVVKFRPDVVFVMAGSGDMERQVIQDSAYLGISDKVLFTGYLDQEKIKSIYQSADVYVMPSVSEPFGIVALEAIANKTPTIISKQSGVSETVQNVLKVDFWDIDEMTNKILALLDHKSLSQCMSELGAVEVESNNWDHAAKQCVASYHKLTNQ
jgi:glycosyltransferase involved in cell wall biosynthesis